MPKGLTRNDLLYILNEIFKISTANNNALSFSEQGLFVESYKVHSENGDLHVPSKEVHDIIAGFSLDANDNLVYNGDPASIRISDNEDNAIELDADGALYVRKVYDQSDFQEHLDDDERHLTQDDRDKLDDGILSDANDYTDEEINKIKIRNVVYSTSVPPAENMDEHTMYIFLDEDNIVENPVIVMKVLNEVVTVGITKATMNLYYTKEECDNKFETIQHATNTYSTKFNNKQVLDQISDDNGHPVFGQNKFISSRANNALSCDENGGLFCQDVAAELHSLQISASFAKTNLYDQEINNTGTYTLKDAISNYNLLLVEYWFYPPTLMQVPIYTIREIVSSKKEEEGYSYEFDPDDTEFLFNQITDKRYSNGFVNRNDEWKCFFDYDVSRKWTIEIRNTSTSDTREYAEFFSSQEYLEYTISFTIINGDNQNSRYNMEMYTICKFTDENDVEHQLAISIPHWQSSSDHNLVVNGSTKGLAIHLLVDPVHVSNNGHNYTAKRCEIIQVNNNNNISSVSAYAGTFRIKIIKTTTNVQLIARVNNKSFDLPDDPENGYSLIFNFNRYAETDIFTNKPGKIGMCFAGYYAHANVGGFYRRIQDINFLQHIWIKESKEVVDRMATIENPDHNIGYAKTAIVDTDNIEYLYRQSIGYTLELGYGISNANIKLRMHDNKLYVDHLANTAIYRITGIGKGQSQEVEPTPDVIIGDDEVDDNIDGNIDDEI